MILNQHGKMVVDIIENQLGQPLPRTGFLAGQSVCSILLYLLGKKKDIEVNDYDIFHHEGEMKKGWNFIPHTFTTTNGVIVPAFKDVALAYRMKNVEKNTGDRGDLLECSDYPIIISDSAKAMVFNADRPMVRTSYSISGVTRRGLINDVFYSSERNSNLFNPMSVISGFDINCTEVGIDLRTMAIYYTRAFLKFVHGLQLEITNITRPYHTFIRYMMKMQQHSYFGSLEVASRLCSTSIALANLSSGQPLYDLEIDASEQFIGRDMKQTISKFGVGYIDKFNSVKGIRDFATMQTSISNVKLVKSFEEYLVEKNGGKPIPVEKVKLARLNFRDEPYEFIVNGNHRNAMGKKYGRLIMGYPVYAKYDLCNIVAEHLNLAKKSYVQGSSKLKLKQRFKKYHEKTPYDIMRSIFYGDAGMFAGNYTLEHIGAISNLLYRHKGLKRFFVDKTMEQSYIITKKFNWLEKRFPVRLHALERCDYFDVLGLSNEQLAERSLIEYELYLDKISNEKDGKAAPFLPIKILNHLVIALHSKALLNDETSIVNHCVWSFSDLLGRPDHLLMSIRENTFIRSTLHVSKLSGKWYVSQHRAFKNQKPKEKHINVASKIIDMLNSGEIVINENYIF